MGIPTDSRNVPNNKGTTIAGAWEKENPATPGCESSLIAFLYFGAFLFAELFSTTNKNYPPYIAPVQTNMAITAHISPTKTPIQTSALPPLEI